MKVRMTTLFEQGERFERWVEKPGAEFVWRDGGSTSFQPSYHDEYVYVHLYQVGGDTILHTVKRVNGNPVFFDEHKEILDSEKGNFENIRTAIARFDSMFDEFMSSPVSKPVEREDEFPF